MVIVAAVITTVFWALWDGPLVFVDLKIRQKANVNSKAAETMSFKIMDKAFSTPSSEVSGVRDICNPELQHMETVERWREQQGEGKSQLSAWGRGGMHLSEGYGPWNLGEPQELGHRGLWEERCGDWRQRGSLEVLVRGTQTFAGPNSDSMFCRREEVYFLYFFFFIIVF